MDESGRQALAAAGAAAGKHIAAANGGHASAETMAALADKLGGLKGALHDKNSVLGCRAKLLKLKRFDVCCRVSPAAGLGLTADFAI
jgi:hypothetical protein